MRAPEQAAPVSSRALMPPRSCCYPRRRINIGERYQAEIPALQDQHCSQFDQHRADLVWQPVDDSHPKPGQQRRRQYHTSPPPAPRRWCLSLSRLKLGFLSSLVEELMSMACSSVLRGGGTNQELVLHCLHECGGDILVSTVVHGHSDVQFAGFSSRNRHQSFKRETPGVLTKRCDLPSGNAAAFDASGSTLPQRPLPGWLSLLRCRSKSKSVLFILPPFVW